MRSDPELIARLVEFARRTLNHDAGDDEPQDLYEIQVLTAGIKAILERVKQ